MTDREIKLYREFTLDQLIKEARVNFENDRVRENYDIAQRTRIKGRHPASLIFHVNKEDDAYLPLRLAVLQSDSTSASKPFYVFPNVPIHRLEYEDSGLSPDKVGFNDNIQLPNSLIIRNSHFWIDHKRGIIRPFDQTESGWGNKEVYEMHGNMSFSYTKGPSFSAKITVDYKLMRNFSK